MRRFLTTAALVAAMTLGAATAALAQQPPCNDADGDGSPSGHEYAQHHIVELARIGGLGADGHIPGSHQGFSVCL